MRGALPVGYHALHRDRNLNFQLNRLVSDGNVAMLDEVRAIAPHIRTFDDWSRELFAFWCSRSSPPGSIARPARHEMLVAWRSPGSARSRATFA